MWACTCEYLTYDETLEARCDTVIKVEEYTSNWTHNISVVE
jgi:hypothetical protein